MYTLKAYQNANRMERMSKNGVLLEEQNKTLVVSREVAPRPKYVIQAEPQIQPCLPRHSPETPPQGNET